MIRSKTIVNGKTLKELLFSGKLSWGGVEEKQWFIEKFKLKEKRREKKDIVRKKYFQASLFLCQSRCVLIIGWFLTWTDQKKPAVVDRRQNINSQFEWPTPESAFPHNFFAHNYIDRETSEMLLEWKMHWWVDLKNCIGLWSIWKVNLCDVYLYSFKDCDLRAKTMFRSYFNVIWTTQRRICGVESQSIVKVIESIRAA